MMQMMRLAEPDVDGAYKTDDNEIAVRMPMFSMKQMRRALSLAMALAAACQDMSDCLSPPYFSGVVLFRER